MNILSIQSWVSYGHVGNAAAVFPLQRLGAEVWAVNTVQFSNHTGYGDWTGQVFSGAQVAAVIEGLKRRGALARADAVLSGYMGDASIGETILTTVDQVRSLQPAALYCCDPVIGDDGTGVYVRPGIAALLRDRAVPCADILTPNQFELAQLTGLPCGTLPEARLAVATLQQRMRGPRCVLVTSLQTDVTPSDSIDMLVAADGQFHLLRTPRLPLAINGAGDLIAALFLFHFWATRSAPEALAKAGAALHGVLKLTADAAARELLLVQAQAEIVSPSEMFAVAVLG